jgi:hypothetical protein
MLYFFLAKWQLTHAGMILVDEMGGDAAMPHDQLVLLHRGFTSVGTDS